LAANADAGLQMVLIRETNNENGPALVRSTAPLLIGTEQAADVGGFDFADPVIVIRSPYHVSFSYAGPDRVWRDRWKNQLVLPRAIRVQVRDSTNLALLAATTSTLVYTELPARCTWVGMAPNCTIAASAAPN
jgi:general secretion pathway protein J